MKLILIVMIMIFNVSAYANSSASILLYHHVSDTTPKSTSISPKLFKQHLKYLEDNHFNVLPLEQIISSLKNKEKLPNKTVAITFDDAYKSVLYEAAVLLEKKSWPFSVFVNAQATSAKYKNYLSWNELKTIIKKGGTIGSHSYDHAHLVRKLKNESNKDYENRIYNNLKKDRDIIENKLDIKVKMFAYPYGEYNDFLKKTLKSFSYYGLGQQSGAVGQSSDFLAIPRFPMAMNYAKMNNFITRVNTLAFDIKNVNIGESILIERTMKNETFSFDVKIKDFYLRQLACYSFGKSLKLTKTKKDDFVNISMSLPNWYNGRQKINCTAPSINTKKAYYWYSNIWLVKKQNNKWYKE